MIQRGERIRVLSDNDLNKLGDIILETLRKHNLEIHSIEYKVEIDMVDYFTYVSILHNTNEVNEYTGEITHTSEEDMKIKQSEMGAKPLKFAKGYIKQNGKSKELVVKLVDDQDMTDEDKIIEMEQRLGDWEPSLDHPVGDDWRETRGDLLSSDKETFDVNIADHELQQIFTEKLKEFRQGLEEKEREILENRILSDTPATLQAIGDKYGISKERVRQIETRLIGKIKQYMEQQLPDFKRFQLLSPKKD